MRILPKKLSKLSINLNPILHNQIILYFITLVAIVDIFFLLNERDISSFIILLLVGLLTSFFSKNMIVIFVISLSVTHILKYGNSAYVSEGFKGDDSSDKSDDVSDTDSVADGHDEKKKDKKNLVKDVSSAEENTGKQDKVEYADLKKEYQDFQGIQDKILGAMQEIDPLLSRAETFIEKFERYKEQNKDKLSNNNSE